MIVNNKIGITLSGGGFRGIAHLGVLQCMEELGISFDAISGASAGALIGAFIAEGYSPAEIFKFAKTEKFSITQIYFEVMEECSVQIYLKGLLPNISLITVLSSSKSHYMFLLLI